MEGSRAYRQNALFIILALFAIVGGIAYYLHRECVNDYKKTRILNFARNICYCDNVSVNFLSCRDSLGKSRINCEITFFSYDSIYNNANYLNDKADRLAPSVFYSSMDSDTSTYYCLTLVFRGSAYQDRSVFNFLTNKLYYDWPYKR